jgi:predicted ATPase
MSLNAMLENYISHVHIENFRSLANVDVDLLPLTVLVGANGSGKSNFIDALRFVRDSLTRTPDGAIEANGGFAQLAYKAPHANASRVQFHFSMISESRQCEYTYAIEAADNTYGADTVRVAYERLDIDGKPYFEQENTRWKLASAGMTSPIAGLGLYTLSQQTGIQPFYHMLANQRYYTLYPNALRSSVEPRRKYFDFDEAGSSIESALAFFLERGTWQIDLRNTLQLIVPHIDDFELIAGDDGLRVLVRHTNGEKFRLLQESDGTLRVIGLLLALYRIPPLPLIAIEEPELAVHPGALGILVDVIEEAALRMQVIVTTHSPDLIARFRAGNLRIVEWTDEGTKIGPLEERQRDVIERQLFDAGDLLRIEGLVRAPKGS